MLKKYQTDSHVIYGTLRLEIFIKYPLITRESRLFAEIRVYIVDCLQKRKVAFKSIVDGIDTNSALGRCQFGIFASLAEYEREIIVERTRAGLQAAKERGKLTGRPIGLSEDAKRKAIAAKRLYENRDYSIGEICRILHIGSKATLYRYLRYEKVRLMNRRNK